MIPFAVVLFGAEIQNCIHYLLSSLITKRLIGSFVNEILVDSKVYLFDIFLIIKQWVNFIFMTLRLTFEFWCSGFLIKWLSKMPYSVSLKLLSPGTTAPFASQ